MAVVSAKEIWQGRNGTDDTRVRAYTRVWRVITDSRHDDSTVVMPACGIIPGSLHPNDATAFCRSADASNDSENPYIWQVTFTYSNERELQDNPLNDPADIQWADEPYQRPLVVDKDGDLVLNSAGDWFDPPYMIDDSRLVVTVTKNVGAVPSYILGYRNVVNSDSFTVDGVGVPSGKAKIKAISVSGKQERNGVVYRTLTIPIYLDEDGWKVKILDQGMFQVVAGQRQPCTILGKSVSVPVPLDGNGLQLQNPSPTNCVAREFDGYKTKVFSILPLS